MSWPRAWESVICASSPWKVSQVKAFRWLSRTRIISGESSLPKHYLHVLSLPNISVQRNRSDVMQTNAKQSNPQHYNSIASHPPFIIHSSFLHKSFFIISFISSPFTHLQSPNQPGWPACPPWWETRTLPSKTYFWSAKPFFVDVVLFWAEFCFNLVRIGLSVTCGATFHFPSKTRDSVTCNNPSCK